MDLISKAEAVRLQLPTFFTGKPCRRGHRATRRTRDGSCTACLRLSPSHQRRKLKRAIEQGKVFSVLSVSKYYEEGGLYAKR